MGKLNIAQNERLCYFKQLFPMERILDLNFKNLGSVPALPLSMSVITGKLFPLSRTWFPHVQNGSTGTSRMVCKPRRMLYIPAVCTLPVCWCQSDPSLPEGRICLFCLHKIPGARQNHRFTIKNN